MIVFCQTDGLQRKYVELLAGILDRKQGYKVKVGICVLAVAKGCKDYNYEMYRAPLLYYPWKKN